MAQGKNQAIIKEIKRILKATCQINLDDEYRDLSFRILQEIAENEKLCRSLSRSKPESWAAGILTVLGRINFLSDSTFEPYMTLEQLAISCGVSYATGATKADRISAELDIDRGPTGFDYQVPSVRKRFADCFVSPQDIIRDIKDSFCEMFNVNPQDVPDELAKFFGEEPAPPEKKSQELLPHFKRIFANINNSSNQPDIISISSETIYQIKISLKYSNPNIWRRIQTPDMPLNILGHVIEMVMGWEGGHLHHFEIDREFYGDPSILDGCADEQEIYLSDLVPYDQKKKKKFIYLYDFGDSWEHEIVIEKQIESMEQWAQPRCIAGENACPPEDCGGVWGYLAMLEAKDDPDNDEFDGYFDLDNIDPEKFDLADVNSQLGRLKRVPYPPG